MKLAGQLGQDVGERVRHGLGRDGRLRAELVIEQLPQLRLGDEFQLQPLRGQPRQFVYAAARLTGDCDHRHSSR
ncbi:MAG: hypothetical protein IPJ98_13900 [Bryobacterales bacterium]|nr:hypothetical protein [Bryobacterales bacterium]